MSISTNPNNHRGPARTARGGDCDLVLTQVSLHDDLVTAEGTLLLALPLHLDDAADTKDMRAPETHRVPGNREADRARVVINPGHNRDDLLRQLSTHLLGHVPG